MKSTQLKSSLLLFICASIWGVAFVAQSEGMKYIGPFSFTCIRNIMGAVVLLPLALFSKEKSESGKSLVTAGVLCGIALGLASCLQQYGIQYTTTGKAGFVTALYIIMIPIAELFFKKKSGIFIWAAVILALIGVYLLCIKEGFSVNKGDVYIFFCAIVFTIQMLLVAHFSPKLNAFRFACIEFAAAGLFSAIPMLFTETLSVSAVTDAAIPLLYTGIMSSGVGYTLQIIGQKKLNPTVAALIMSMESCISAIAGWLLLSQALSAKEIIGCIIMFAAIVLAQI